MSDGEVIKQTGVAPEINISKPQVDEDSSLTSDCQITDSVEIRINPDNTVTFEDNDIPDNVINSEVKINADIIQNKENSTATIIETESTIVTPNKNTSANNGEIISENVGTSDSFQDNVPSSNISPQVIQGFRRESDSIPTISSSGQDKEVPIATTRIIEPTTTSPVVTSEPIAECPTMHVSCQTEWSWLEDMKSSQKMRNASSRTTRSIINTTAVNPYSLGARSSSISLSGVSGRRTPSKVPSVIDLAGSARSKRDSAFSGDNFTPAPLRLDEYGIPVLNISSDEESDDGDRKSQAKFSARTISGITPLPSIGPPPILQYQPESRKSELPGSYLDQQKGLIELQNNAMNGGLKCDFCNALIKSFPSLDDQKEFPPDVLFCCDEYKRHLYAALTHPATIGYYGDTKIDTAPHPPYGSKHARKVAKERAAQRLREREMARQQASFATNHPIGNSNAGVSSFFQFARQMKTINYMLSSQRCMDEGWTIRPPSPLVEFLSRAELFEPEPVLPAWIEGYEKSRSHRKLVRKFYPSGSLFVTQFTDGTGSVFHSNGKPAITISSVELGVYTYVVQNEAGHVIAVFYTGGSCLADFAESKPRLYINKVGGLELNEFGGRKRIWNWHTKEHVHAPPIQPIVFNMGDKKFGVRVAAQDNITLSFSSSKHACRFQVGSKLKVSEEPYSLDELQPVKVIDENFKYRKDIQKRVRDVLRRVTELLRFPNAVGKFGVGVSGGGGSGACTTSGDNGVTVTAGGAVITATGQAIDGSGGSSRDEAEEQQPTTGASAGGGVCCGGAASLIKGAGLERRPSRRLRKLPEVVVS